MLPMAPPGAALAAPPPPAAVPITPAVAAAAASSISPLAASAIAAGSVAGAALPAVTTPPLAPSTGSSVGGEPQLSEMDLMLADLAFAARPPPVMTPDEPEAGGESVVQGLGSLSPSNFSPGTMMQQLLTTPNGTNGWSATQIAEMSQPVAAAAAGKAKPAAVAPTSA